MSDQTPQAQPAAAVAPKSTSGMAIASLVTGILGISLLAVIFGHIGINACNRDGLGGKGMAIAGLVLGYLGLVVGIFIIIGAVSATATAGY